jgi:hypothetical protein
MKRKTGPALFVRFVKPVRSIASVGKKVMPAQPKRHTLDLARGASGEDADRADMPLRTEQTASFADVCCATSQLRIAAQ